MSENGREHDLDAAAAVFERVLASLEGAPAATNGNGNGNGHAPKAARERLTQVRSAAARTMDLYGELFQRAFETYADLAQAALQPGTDPAPETPLALAAAPGGEASTPLWIHNLSGTAVTDLALRLTDLTAAHGARIPGARATFVPGGKQVDPGTSARTILRVAIPAAAPLGLYHGHVLCPALPGIALGVRLTVQP